MLAGGSQVTLSAGRTGQCWDNALSEPFFASIKGELPGLQAWPTATWPAGGIVAPGCTAPSDTAAPPISKKQQDQEGSVTKRSALSVKAGQPHDAERRCSDAKL